MVERSLQNKYYTALPATCNSLNVFRCPFRSFLSIYFELIIWIFEAQQLINCVWFPKQLNTKETDWYLIEIARMHYLLYGNFYCPKKKNFGFMRVILHGMTKIKASFSRPVFPFKKNTSTITKYCPYFCFISIKYECKRLGADCHDLWYIALEV